MTLSHSTKVYLVRLAVREVQRRKKSKNGHKRAQHANARQMHLDCTRMLGQYLHTLHNQNMCNLALLNAFSQILPVKRMFGCLFSFWTLLQLFCTLCPRVTPGALGGILVHLAHSAFLSANPLFLLHCALFLLHDAKICRACARDVSATKVQG